MTPGPVEVPRRILEASASRLVSHRSGEFRALLRAVAEGLEHLAGASEALVLPGSGTTAVDSMVWSLVSPGERVLVVSHGEFGRRLARAIEARGAAVRILEAPRPGEVVDLSMVEEELSRGGYEWLALVHTETSMGVTLRGLGRLVDAAHSAGADVMVDAVSSFPVEEVDVNGLGIAAVATCSHKALASPPGAAVVLLGAPGVERLEGRGRTPGIPPSLDLALSLRFKRERGETPFTPPVTILYALRESLRVIGEQGLHNWRRLHAERVEALYRLLEPHGYRRVPGRGLESWSVAALWTPIPSGEAIRAALGAGYRIAPGMGGHRESMIRVGVMGDVSLDDVKALAEALAAASEAYGPPGPGGGSHQSSTS